MKLVILLLVTLGAAVGFVLLAMEDPGYLVLVRTPYTVRLPLALFVLIVVAVFAGLYLLFNFIVTLLRAPKMVRKWRERSHQTHAQLCTMRGYASLIEGDWSSAEKKLLTNLRHNKSPLLNYLGAAFAAQQRGHLVRRDQYLADALAHHPQQQLAINLTAARLHYQAGEVVESRDVLEQLRKTAPKSVPAARLLADVYRELKDWNSLATLMPSLVRLKAFPPDELAAREKLVHENFLSSPALLQGDGERSEKAFKSLPRARKKDPAVLAGYVRQLIKAGEHVPAERTLRIALNRGWNAELAYLYGKTETAFVGDQLKLVKSWARKYGSHADLTLTLGRLYRRDRQFSKARDLFGQVISGGGRREEACMDLGALLEELGETDAALRCYRQGMAALAPELEIDEALPAAVGELVAPGDAAHLGGSEVMPVVR